MAPPPSAALTSDRSRPASGEARGRARAADEALGWVYGREAVRLEAFLAPAAMARSPRRTYREDELVPQSGMLAELERAMRELRRPSLPIDFASSIRVADMGVYGFAVQTAPTIGAALERSVRFQRLMTSWGSFALAHRPASIRFLWIRAAPRTLGVRVLGEVVLAEHTAIYRLMVPQARPVQVHFAHPPPGDTRAHRAFFRCPITWSAAEDSVEWPAGNLGAPLFGDGAIGDYFFREAERRVAQLPRGELAEQVRALLAWRLSEGADQRSVARALGRSPRALRRELATAGWTFRDLLDEARRAQVEGLLRQGLPITEIALQVGYSETSALSRRLRAWRNAGWTPPLA